MTLLPNGCRCGDFTVNPANWNTKRASMSKDWYFTYWFYDPKFPKPKQRIVKGMNKFKALALRQQATTEILKDEMNLLMEGYNPILGEFVMLQADIQEVEPEITGKTPFIQALRKALELMPVTDPVRIDLRSVLKYFELAAILVRKSDTPLNDIKRKDIRFILNACEKVKKTANRPWTDNQFNHYRAHISMIYSYLNREEIVDYNPVEKIEKKEVIRSARSILTDEQRIIIDNYLLKHLSTFHRYVNIFFHSGARRAELLRLQGEHVDLPRQRYRLLIKKRKKKVWEWKVIKDVALPFWIEAMQECGAKDFVFSKNLVPGPVQINPKQITRRWLTHVKKKLKISVDFYSLKHLHTTEVMDILDQAGNNENDAVRLIAEHNSHTSGEMVKKVYDKKNGTRKENKIKTISNGFVPVVTEEMLN